MIELEQVKLQWVVPEKIHTPPTEEISAVRRGEKKLFLIIVNVLGHPKGVGGLTSYFVRGGGMDVFWNDPMCLSLFCYFKLFNARIFSRQGESIGLCI
jgi:hypothetical protein